ncbi:sensor histidine kinase [Bacillus sp. JCM 19034]|uniref:sensor histidine kinase n=1 Tax=Bacillus sp. JCM 19034 TaxID=1481928 RepID=UPI000A5E4532|nr:sensor histidine kinase [Bacillus sp. JCM 19034]
MRYYHFNKRLHLLLEEQFAELRPMSKEQALFKHLLDKINQQSNATNRSLVEQHKEGMTFLSHWIHHLKTPVSVMELILDRQTEGGGDADTIEKLKQENKRLHTRIEQGLTMVRMERFENDLTIQALDLVALLREVINERKTEFIYNQVYPVINSQQEKVAVLTDKKWNKLMLDQIISNAIKYSSGLGKQMTITIELRNHRTLVSIKDRGVGIPSYDLERIFDPFFTGENGRELRNSSGIGLYLCKKVADRLGHALSVQSEVGKGTNVTIEYLTKT